MANVWTFGAPKDDEEVYSDGTVVPHRFQEVLLNGVKVGYVEIHMHKRAGDDHIPDMSFGFTGVTYGPVAGGK